MAHFQVSDKKISTKHKDANMQKWRKRVRHPKSNSQLSKLYWGKIHQELCIISANCSHLTKSKFNFPHLVNILSLYDQKWSETSKLELQSRKPVLRHTAFRTWRRSLPFNVLPTPSSTEDVVFGDRREPRATISCGGNISSSASSSSSSAWARELLLALDRTGMFIGADWWNLLIGREWECLFSREICGGLGIAGTALIDDGNEVFRFSIGGASIVMFWSESVKVARIPWLSGVRKWSLDLPAPKGLFRRWFGSTKSLVQNTSSSLKSPPEKDESPVEGPDWPEGTPRRRAVVDRRWLELLNRLVSISFERHWNRVPFKEVDWRGKCRRWRKNYEEYFHCFSALFYLCAAWGLLAQNADCDTCYEFLGPVHTAEEVATTVEY